MAREFLKESLSRFALAGILSLATACETKTSNNNLVFTISGKCNAGAKGTAVFANLPYDVNQGKDFIITDQKHTIQVDVSEHTLELVGFPKTSGDVDIKLHEEGSTVYDIHATKDSVIVSAICESSS